MRFLIGGSGYELAVEIGLCLPRDRGTEKHVRWCVFLYLAFRKKQDIAGQSPGLVEIVGGHYDACTLLVKFLYGEFHGLNRGRIQCGGGFIKKQHCR